MKCEICDKVLGKRNTSGRCRNHLLWTGDNASNQAQRKRCRKIRGDARDHKCEHCTCQAYDWAHIHGKSGNDVWKDFIPLCRHCHTVYDGHHTVKGNSIEIRSARTRAQWAEAKQQGRNKL